MQTILKSLKLDDVCYDIRGPVLETARRMEEDGHRILKLNIGNPAAFGFEAPDDILKDVIHNLPEAQGYCDAKGLYSARVAVMQYYQRWGIQSDVDDIYIGNGVSELIQMATQGLLNNGDEMLLPSPDYPLWTASVKLAGGTPVHYRCDEESGWLPDIDDIKRKITPHTRALVLINPNNPTGAVYPRELLLQLCELARQHRLIIFADEIYDKVLYDDAEHIPVASLAPDLFVVTFSGLSKNYRIAGFRIGWMILTGAKQRASDYIAGLDMLASMRLCANVPCQHAVQTALGGYQSINDLVRPGGRLYQQRNTAWEQLNAIDGVSCVKPMGAMYAFMKLDQQRFNLYDDEKLVLDFLTQHKVLLVPGSAFNLDDCCHLRLVFLPHQDVLTDAIQRLGEFLDGYRQS